MSSINYIEKHFTTFSVKPHKHRFWEIIYVTEGEGVIETENGEKTEYKKGDTICIPPEIFHTNNSSVGFKNIHFTIDGWDRAENTPIVIPASDFGKDFYQLLKLTYRYFHQFPIAHPLNVSLSDSVEKMLDFLVGRSETARITQIILHEIINHYTDADFDLDKAYGLLPLSKEYIRKIFIKEHGISPSKFLRQKRISLAKQLLYKRNDENLRKKEIANACGFSSQAYFTRAFKKETGVTPNEFFPEQLRSNKIYPQ